MSKDRVIITGSNGLIGSDLVNNMKANYKINKLSLSLGHDLTEEDFVKDYFSHNDAEYLVNCFGYNDHVEKTKNKEGILDVTLESINKYLMVNVLALFSVCREFAKNSKAKGIVNISSIYGQVSPKKALYEKSEKHIGYSISKAAVNQMTRHLATHLAPKIRVNCISLGGIEPRQGSAFIKKYSQEVPMRRMMKTDEVFGIINYICSDKSTYTTGSIINIDGGWTS